MTESKTLLIRLRPLRPWFFGSEQTFGAGAQRNYFAQSLRFPQQTSLLGLVRHQLLLQNGFLDNPSGHVLAEKLEDAVLVVGDSGFSKDNERGYGTVAGISPLFVSRKQSGKWENWLIGPQVLRKTGYKDPTATGRFAPLQFQVGQGIAVGPSGLSKPLPVLTGFDRKLGLEDVLVNQKGESRRYKEVFKEHLQVGIEKSAGDADDEKKFYRQQYYRFADASECFSFFLTLRKDEKLGMPTLATSKVNFGGERSPFIMEVETTQERWDSFQLPAALVPQGRTAIVLASNAWIDSSYHVFCDFEASHVVDFRYHRSSLKGTTNWYRLSEGSNADVQRSQRFRLLSHGSVLFANDVTKLKELLDLKAWQTIGYNHYFEISSNDLNQ